MGGPFHNSHSAETDLTDGWGPDGPPRVWSRPCGTGYALPVVAGGRVLLYHRTSPDGIDGSTEGDEEVLACLDAATGRPLWADRRPATYVRKYDTYSDGPYATPAVSGGAVFAISASAVLRRFATGDGAVAWERDLVAEFGTEPNAFAFGSSQLVADGVVYVNVGGTTGGLGGAGSGIVAFDAATGGTRWTATDDADSYASPRLGIVHGRPRLFVLTKTHLRVLDPSDGAVLGSAAYEVRGPDRVTAVSPVVAGNFVMITGGPGPGPRVYAVAEDGSLSELWKDRRVLDSQFNNLLPWEGVVYGFTSPWTQGEFRCVDMATGEKRWGWEASDLRRGSSLGADGKIFLLGEAGRLALLRADTEKPVVLGETDGPVMKAPTFAAPALAAGRLYIRNDFEVACFDVRKLRGDL
ncbi:MAG: PQQ-binding-like beta-propeller repeat protein [Planctomycetota bacterium]